MIRLRGVPNPRQKEFFDSRAKYIAYGGARGGGKSWALRRKLILMALRYDGLRALIIRRTYAELRENHILPLQAEIGALADYSELQKTFVFPNKSRIRMGYCATEADVLQYQGQEYDIIAIDEATQLSEYQFATLKACLRGVNDSPKRMYLTCNPGGVGHSWVKRLFVDRQFRVGERAEDYVFIPARVWDNEALVQANPDYVSQLSSLPDALRRAWLDGEWDVFEGQFFSEFSREVHVCEPQVLPSSYVRFGAMDYGFDMLAVLWIAVSPSGDFYVYRELCRPNLTLSEAAREVASLCRGERISYLVASPDLWNRRQDSGFSGEEIMAREPYLPPLLRADDRRIVGWRTLREYLCVGERGVPRLHIFSHCTTLIRSMESLLFDRHRAEDAASEPHAVTHAPEALRYAVMSRAESLAEPSVWVNTERGVSEFLRN